MASDAFWSELDDLSGQWNCEPSRAELFEQFTSAVYTTDAEGWLTYYNAAAADLWGYRPELGKARWCGSWRIFTPEGANLPLEQCPMAVALKERRTVRGVQAVLERPDGTLIPFTPYPTPLRDASGAIVAGSNMLLPLASPAAPRDFALPGDASPAMQPQESRSGLALDDLTGGLQATLAALADVEVEFQLDRERLDGWSGPASERERIIAQLESKRARRRALLSERLDELQVQAMRLTSNMHRDGFDA
ncbi:PAS domain-containing protein [Methylobacterium nodulans]|uniref:PAS fold-4 domain protein n=1 Tax=Methylobacterium nodulans (strain LMG 21967 / CNCM I-2342 / ORS 2060) TaxID=460265 RepID=B8IFC2_METNO|nr:PAS domain-containing protein [Methylobacterium nodulans]ACL57657.1 PAS fold-4 domain protein [Methylobacterium nodulans ORS 2060]